MLLLLLLLSKLLLLLLLVLLFLITIIIVNIIFHVLYRSFLSKNGLLQISQDVIVFQCNAFLFWITAERNQDLHTLSCIQFHFVLHLIDETSN